MSHSLLASIWDALQRRNDTANLLREIVGQHTLDLLLYNGSSSADVLIALRPVVWIKAIFDLQRTYLQAAAGVEHCNVPGLLPSDLLHSTLLYLVHVKSKLFSGRVSSADLPRQRLLLVYTILSGFRLFSLLDDISDPERLKQLQRALETAWQDGRSLPECEDFIISELLPIALDSGSPIGMQSGNAYSLSLRQIGLPTFSEGLYPLWIRPRKLIEHTFTNISNGRPMWLTSYWTLFDAIWSVESALLQAYVDQNSRTREPASPGSPNIPQLHNARKNLLSAIFTPQASNDASPGSCILNSLKATVVEWWLDDIEEMSPTTSGKISEKEALEIRYSLDSFKTWVKDRSALVSPSPLRQVPLVIHASERTNSNPFANRSSRDSIGRAIGFPGDLDTIDTPPSSNATNSSHTTTSGSFSSSVPGAIRRSSSPRSEPVLSPFTSVNSPLSRSRSDERTPTTIISESNETIPTTISSSSQEPWVTRGGTFRRPWKSKEKKSKDLETCRPSSFSFSSSGSQLLLWGGNIRGFMRLNIPIVKDSAISDYQKWDLSAVKQVAGGNKRCVVVASHQERFKLVSFISDKPRPEAQIDIDIPLRHYTDTCIAMSKDDRFAALAVDDVVHLYHLSAGNMRRIPLHENTHLYQCLATQRREGKNSTARALNSREAAREAQNQSAVVERRLSFSPSGDRLVVATHLADHHVYVDVYQMDCDPCIPLTPNPRCFELPPWTASDGGLTDVFFDDASQCALMTAFISKEYPTLMYFNNDENAMLRDGSFTSKIVHGAQGANSSLIIANGMTEIMHLTWKANGTINSRKLKKCASKIPPNNFKPGNMVLAMPETHTAYAFWMKDSKLLLRRMNIRDTESYTDLDLRNRVDRLHSEIAESIILSNSSLALGTYDRPSMLYSDTTIRPLVELPDTPLVELPENPRDTAG